MSGAVVDNAGLSMIGIEGNNNLPPADTGGNHNTYNEQSSAVNQRGPPAGINPALPLDTGENASFTYIGIDDLTTEGASTVNWDFNDKEAFKKAVQREEQKILSKYGLSTAPSGQIVPSVNRAADPPAVNVPTTFTTSDAMSVDSKSLISDAFMDNYLDVSSIATPPIASTDPRSAHQLLLNTSRSVNSEILSAGYRAGGAISSVANNVNDSYMNGTLSSQIDRDSEMLDAVYQPAYPVDPVGHSYGGEVDDEDEEMRRMEARMVGGPPSWDDRSAPTFVHVPVRIKTDISSDVEKNHTWNRITAARLRRLIIGLCIVLIVALFVAVGTWVVDRQSKPKRVRVDQDSSAVEERPGGISTRAPSPRITLVSPTAPPKEPTVVRAPTRKTTTNRPVLSIPTASLSRAPTGRPVRELPCGLDNSTAKIFVNEQVGYQTCRWLMIRPALHDQYCQPGTTLYQNCRSTCCHIPPTEAPASQAPISRPPVPDFIRLPTRAPGAFMPSAQPSATQSATPSAQPSVSQSASPSAELTNKPSQRPITSAPIVSPTLEPTRAKVPTWAPIAYADCFDLDPLKPIFINPTLQFQTCEWLSQPGHEGQRNAACQQGKEAFAFCPRTCGRCQGPPIAPPTKSPVKASRDPTLSPTESPTSPPLSDLEKILVEALPGVESGGISPQGKAMDWMLKHGFEFLSEYSTDRIRQRFALATFGLATSYEGWGKNGQWLDSVTSECFWQGIACDEEKLVVSLQLPQNGLAGFLVPELATMMGSSLVWLDVSQNALYGAIPTEFGLFQRLQRLSLYRNRLNWRLPPELGNMTALQELDVAYNRLIGDIPTQLGDLETLTQFYFLDNEFTGVIPEGFCVGGRMLALEGDCREVDCRCCTKCYFNCGGGGNQPPCPNR